MMTNPTERDEFREELGREVHSAWRDGMKHQQRQVADKRKKWKTLDPVDQGLDRYIGDRMVRFFESHGWRRFDKSYVELLDDVQELRHRSEGWVRAEDVILVLQTHYTYEAPWTWKKKGVTVDGAREAFLRYANNLTNDIRALAAQEGGDAENVGRGNPSNTDVTEGEGATCMENASQKVEHVSQFKGDESTPSPDPKRSKNETSTSSLNETPHGHPHWVAPSPDPPPDHAEFQALQDAGMKATMKHRKRRPSPDPDRHIDDAEIMSGTNFKRCPMCHKRNWTYRSGIGWTCNSCSYIAWARDKKERSREGFEPWSWKE